MSAPPDPAEIYDRAKAEGPRRLSMTPLEQATTGFIAGVTIVFGIVALAMAHEFVAPGLGEGPAKLAGALAFGTGMIFLGIWLGAAVTWAEIATNVALAAGGNLAGGLLLTTLTHTVRAKSSPGGE